MNVFRRLFGVCWHEKDMIDGFWTGLYLGDCRSIQDDDSLQKRCPFCHRRVKIKKGSER